MEARGLRPLRGPDPRKPLPGSEPRPHFSACSAEARAGADEARGLGAQSRTLIRRRPLSRDWQGRRAPLPLPKTHPSLGAGRGVEGFAASAGEDLGVEAAPPSVASPRWPPCGSLGLHKRRWFCGWESRSSFCLLAETRGRNWRQTPSSAEALDSLSFFCLGRNSPRQPFLSPQ